MNVGYSYGHRTFNWERGNRIGKAKRKINKEQTEGGTFGNGGGNEER